MKPADVTPESTYRRRREILRDAALFAATSTAVGGALLALTRGKRASDPPRVDAPDAALRYAKSRAPIGEAPTPYGAVTTYNNFYEFGLDKEDPAAHAQRLRLRPWTVEVGGEVHRPRTFDVDDLIGEIGLEERVYRMRCVEGWSMVIPWVGFPLAELVRRVEPTSHARFVAFRTLHDPEQMPMQRSDVLAWPYREGLRLDEAVHPLTLLAVGLYGRRLPAQNGAPIRLVVPWKYGFKGAKSIVRIDLVRDLPPTAWNLAAPDEYGFFANVNPAVDHPRWSQATERRIGELDRRPTLPFNGYGEEVASLYAGMDLRRFF